jgi:nitronate monooxygenase
MWPDRRLCELFKIDHPIIQAPMAGSATPELASAVSNMGGLGSLGCGEMTLKEIRAAATAMRAGTNRPFNLNFFIQGAPKTEAAVLQRTRERLASWYTALGLGAPPAELPALGTTFDDERLSLLLDIQPAIVSFHFGVPTEKAIAALKNAGIVLISSATTVAEARALEGAGMDAVIAQGWEAGGHRGSHQPTDPRSGVGTFALVPQIADAVAIPVIAAGGIGDGRGIAAAFALGASGVQMGTAFLSCPEAATDAPRRALLRQASDTDTMVTDAISGRSARAMRSRFAEEMEKSREPLPAFRQMYALSVPLIEAAPDREASFHLYGQAAGLNRDLPAADLFRRLVDEAAEVFTKLSTRSA